MSIETRQLVELKKLSLNPSPLADQFALLLREFCYLAEAEGLPLVPYRSEQLPYFSVLSLEEKRRTWDHFFNYFQTCLGTLETHHTLKDNVGLFRQALKRLQFHVPEEVFLALEDDDVIEIYTSNSIQIFRTFNFFHLVRYTLEDIFCRPWFELYRRDEFTNRANFSAMTKVLNGEAPIPYYANIPVHQVTETQPESCLSTTIQQRFMAPVFQIAQERETVGVINVFKVISHSNTPR